METIVSSYAVILDETLDPLGVFLFHANSERDKNGEAAQPAGWKLPGGGYEKPRDKTPRHTARNETLLEIGLETGLVKFFRGSQYGEALREKKIWTDTDEEENLDLKVYTFFMRRIGSKRKKNVEWSEGGARGSFSLADIILMPLARNTETGEINPYGIHYSARKRIFVTLKRAGYNFLELIPDLSQLIDEIDPSEVGEDVYWILRDALDVSKEPESETLPEETELALNYKAESIGHEKTCSCDHCWQKWWATAPS
mgnify:CR=1 FL=1